ncbi:MAG: VWA domain-containing protein [Cellulomonadaceae bacterium]|jgi:hypothetical protein|nr:VWA domain-containing protein [Cellulomonadaceae bacterium]
MIVQRTRARKNRTARLWRRVAAMTAAALVLGLGFNGTQVALAPAPANAATDATHVDIWVQVGGQRSAGTNKLTGLAGVRLGLFTSAAATSRINQSWALSAASDSDGIARFTNVPISATAGTGGQANYYVKGDSVSGAAASYTFTQKVGTSQDSDGTTVVERDYAFRVPQGTGSLAGSRTYASAGITVRPSGTVTNFGGFILDSNGSTTATNQAQLDESSSIYTLQAPNPPMPASCAGLNIALILDLSGSVDRQNALAPLKNAANAYIDTMAGTSSTMQLVTFSDAANNRTNNSPVSLNNATAVTALKATVNGLTAGGGTNWDAALYTAATLTTKPDVVVMITDGNPTAEDSGGATTSQVNVRDIERGFLAANTLKASGAHIEVLAVGKGVTQNAAVWNLAGISSRDAAPTTRTEGDSWTRTTDYAAAALKLKAVVMQKCTPSIHVTKYIEPWNKSGEANWTVADSAWNFTLSNLQTGWGLDANKGETSSSWSKNTQSGTAAWDLVSPTPNATNGTATVVENQQAGFTMLAPFTGSKNAQCTTFGKSLTTTNTTNGFTVTGVEAADLVTCRVVNKEPAPLNASATLSGSFDGGYDWSLTKTNDVGSGVVRVQAGATQDVEYTLTAQAARVADSGFTATGTVTLTNDQSIARTYNTANITVNGATVTTEPSGTVTVPAKSGSTNGSVTVKVTANFGAITAAPAAARVTVAGLGGGRADVTSSVAGFTLNTPLANATAVLSDEFPEFAAQLGAVEVNAADALAGKDFTYTVTYSADNDALVGSDVADRVIGTCQASEDAAGGIEGTRFVNKATLTWDADVAKAKSTVELCAGQDLTVAKSVDATLVRKLDWDVSKKVLNPSAPTATTEWQDAASKKVENVDGTAQFTYQVTATPLPMTDATWAVTGTITMSNPNPWPVTAQVKDFPSFKDAAECTVVTEADSTEGFVVPASGSRTVTYECDFVEGAARPADTATNTAGIKWDAAEAFSAGSRAKSDAMPVTFVTDPANLLDEYTVTVTDSNVDNHTLCGEDTCTATWNADLTPTVFEYTVNVNPTSDIAPITCNSSAASDWTVNTAALSTGAEDTADVCVWDSRPEATLLFTGSYDVNYGWDIAKSVDKTTVQQATPGSDVDFTYTLDVTASKTFSGANASGTITVTNTSATPLAWSEITPTVVVNTTGGTVTFTKPADEEFLAAGAEGVIQVRWVAAKATGQPSGMFRVDVTAFGQSILNVPNALATVFAFTNADVTEHGRFADITDTFTEFAGVTGLDAEKVLAQGGTQQFIYTASRGADTLVADKTIQVMGDTPEDLTFTAPETIAQCQYTTDKDGIVTLVDEGTTFTNTATITWTNRDEAKTAKDTETVTVCNDAELSIGKAVVGSATRTYAWNIEKKVDAATWPSTEPDWQDSATKYAEHTVLENGAFVTKDIGEASFDYRIVATPGAYSDSAWLMEGTITVDNPNTKDVPVTIADLPNFTASDAAATCTVLDVPEDGWVVPAANAEGPGSLTVNYACVSESATPVLFAGTNTATVAWDGLFTTANSATTAVDFTEADYVFGLVNATVTVTDDQATPADTTDDVILGTCDWSAEGTPCEFSQTLLFTGPEMPASVETRQEFFTDGAINTARIVETGQDDTAEAIVVDVKDPVGLDQTCYEQLGFDSWQAAEAAGEASQIDGEWACATEEQPPPPPTGNDKHGKDKVVTKVTTVTKVKEIKVASATPVAKAKQVMAPLKSAPVLALTGAGIATLLLGLIAGLGGVAAIKPKRREQ